MKILLFFHLLVVDLAVLSLMVSGEPGVTYYVKPSESTKCPGQPCETLNYYLKNVDTTINKEKNLTMIFLNGTHSLDCQILTDNPVIKTPVMRMVGESESTLKFQPVNCNYSGTILFRNNSEVYFKNFDMIDLSVVRSDLPDSYIHMSALNISGFFSFLKIDIKKFMKNTVSNIREIVPYTMLRYLCTFLLCVCLVNILVIISHCVHAILFFFN